MKVQNAQATQKASPSASLKAAPNAPSQHDAGPQYQSASGAPHSQIASPSLKYTIANGSEQQIEQALDKARSENPALYRETVRNYIQSTMAGESKLFKHLAFFDLNGDRRVSVAESRRGMQLLNFSWPMAAAVAVASHMFIGPKTSGGLLGVGLDRVHDAQHPEVNSGTFNKEADAKLEQKLGEIFNFSSEGDGTMSGKDLRRYVNHLADQRKGSFFKRGVAKIANLGEFSTMLTVTGKDTISREEMRDFYNGSLFFAQLPAAELAKRMIQFREAKEA